MLFTYLIIYLFLRRLKKKHVVPKSLFLSQARLSYPFPSHFCHSAPPYSSPYPMPKGLCRCGERALLLQISLETPLSLDLMKQKCYDMGLAK